MSDYNLILGDSSEELQKLIEQGVKVDLTVTSPPYDNLRSYEGKVIWDFEKFKDIANKLYEITTDGGVVIWVVGDQTKNGSESGTSFKQALYFKEVGFKLHDTMIYKKINYVPLNHKRFEQCWEYMFCFSKGKPKTFNPILVPCKNAGKVEKYGGDRRTLLDKNQAIKNPDKVYYMATKQYKIHPNIFEYPTGANKSGHPAAFPKKLPYDQIKSWSNENDIVLDPFMGGGTTGIEAIKLNRKFIGIELVEGYYNIAQREFENLKNE